MNSDFKKDEIVEFERYNKKLKKNVITKFPVVGGRLRLFHEDSKLEAGKSGIQCEVIKYENDVAVIQAVVNLNGCLFTGIGMASKSRDALIFPAILEMAETRAIARALRFAGYGVEYTGAEEMASVKNFESDNKSKGSDDKKKSDPAPDKEETLADEDKPLEHMDDMISPKRLVWEYVKTEYAEVDEKYLADKIKSFVKTAVEKGGDTSEESVFKAILKNKDRFLHAFNSNIKSPKKKEPEKEPENKPEPALNQAYEEKKAAALNKMSIEKNEEINPSAEKLKAQIYMSLPDGVKVGALNDTLDALLADNDEKPAEDIYRIVLADIDTFVKILKDHCAQNGTESGIGETDISVDVDPEPVACQKCSNYDCICDKNKKEKVSEYSEFRSKWANLGLKQFNTFIIKNADTFKEDLEEYNAAVEKFDRLKVKNEDTKNLCFPYMFDYNDVDKPTLSNKESVVPNMSTMQEVSTMKQYLATFPSMCKEVSSITGISIETTDSKEVELFNDCFETTFTNWETKFKQKYVED